MVRSVIYTDTTDEIQKRVVKSIKVLKGNTTITVDSVANFAALRLHSSKGMVKKYLEGLTQQERIILGFPDPNEKPAKSDILLRPTTNVSVRTQIPGTRRR